MATTGSSSVQIASHLASKSMIPTGTWLNDFLASQKPTTPIAAMKQTALFRIMTSDITLTLQNGTTDVFPADILNAEIREQRLTGPIPVQILDVEDIGRSRWSQVEAIEAFERGESTKGREVIRIVPGEEGLSVPEGSLKSGPHKLLLQDCDGFRVYGFELNAISGISTGMSIGSKMILQNVVVARGMLMLEPATVSILGGKIETLHKIWSGSRKECLKSAIASSSAS